MEELNNSCPMLSVENKRNKIKSNYETIEVLKNRLEASKKKELGRMTRAAYIKMILDVTKKVDKQNDELSQAVSETRHLQRDISNLFGRLERSFTLVEQNILATAKSDGWSRECYRLLNVMHTYCDKLIHAVQEISDLKREIRQLENQIGQIKVMQSIQNMNHCDD